MAQLFVILWYIFIFISSSSDFFKSRSTFWAKSFCANLKWEIQSRNLNLQFKILNTNQTIFFFYHAPLCSSIIKTVLTAKLQILYLHLPIYLSVCPMFFSWPFSIILLLEAQLSVSLSCLSEFFYTHMFLFSFLSQFFVWNPKKVVLS